jgi:hypothetical protein
MKQASRIWALVLAVAATAGVAMADILDEYQKRYSQSAEVQTNRVEAVNALAASGKVEAVKALSWCVAFSKDRIGDFEKSADKVRAKRQTVVDKIVEKENNWREQLKKQGKPVPDKRTRYPEDDELILVESELLEVERGLAAERAILADAFKATGTAVAKLTPDAQKAVRDDWTKNRLAQKDWGVRAEGYELLGHTPTDWAVEMLLAAISTEPNAANVEPDARAIIMAIDALSGRDPARVGPAIAKRIDDVRWLVRVTVIQALENTPSKEGIDAIVKRLGKEDGRLKDDCRRALHALTGNDMPANPEMWKNWWELNREKWKGKPEKPKDDAIADPLAGLGKTVEDPAAKKTGFFGIQLESRRVVFVIDISGSMNANMGGHGAEAKSSRAELARAELLRVVAALEDGTLFDIVFFSSGVKVWKPEMQTADGKTRKEAIDYVQKIEFGGGTNTYDALEAAFALGDVGKGKRREADPTGEARVDTIMFLSDGKPSVGKITDPDQIRAAVKGWNKARRVAVHSIAFGAASGKKDGMDGADPAFMKGLAADTGGKYVEK